MNNLKVLLQNDNSLNKPRRIKWGGRLTKKFLAWNRKQIRAGRTNYYADERFLYNAQTKRFIKGQFDNRYKTRTLKKSFRKRFSVQGSVLMNRDDKVYKYQKGADYDELQKNWLLREIILNNNISGNYRIIIKETNGPELFIHDQVYEIPSTGVGKWYDSVYNEFRASSDKMKWNLYQGDGTSGLIAGALSDMGADATIEGDITFIFSKLTTITQKYFQQSFLDGVSHCFFTPVINWANQCLENSKSKGAKARYQTIINKIEGKELKSGKKIVGFKEQYIKGIPEPDIGMVCEELQIGVEIDQPFQNKKFFEYRSMKKPLKVFNFLNTRLNHIEEQDREHNFNYVYDNYAETKIVTRDELYNLKKEFDEENTFYTYSKDFHGISAIRTIDKVYHLKDDYHETVKEFENANFNYYHYDARKYPKLHNFIMNGTHFNGTSDFIDTSELDADEDDVKHIDLKKAYTQYKQTKYYCGFMGKITDFRKVDNYNQVGYYYITHLDLSDANKKFVKLNDKLGWFVTKNIYSKGELDCLSEMGATFKVKYGAYGIKCDFDLSEEMINNKETVTVGDRSFKIAYYAKWVGMMASIRENRSIYMNGDDKFFQTLQTDYDIQVSEWDGEKRVIIPKHTINSKRHIAGQIVAYQRLVMLEQLMKMDLDKLIRICVDGIYYYEHDFESSELFVPKDKKTFKNSETARYLSHIVEDKGEIVTSDAYELEEYEDDLGTYLDYDYSKPTTVVEDDKLQEKLMGCPIGVEPRAFYKKELFLGAGGNGKTHFNLYDEGLINVVYVAPSWKLTSAKKKEMENSNIDCIVHQRLFYEPYSRTEKYISRWNNYIIDEASMIIEGIKDYVFKNVLGKIVFCGDIGYQLPPVVTSQIKLMWCEKYMKTHKVSDKCYMILKYVKDVTKLINKAKNKEIRNEIALIMKEYDEKVIEFKDDVYEFNSESECIRYYDGMVNNLVGKAGCKHIFYEMNEKGFDNVRTLKKNYRVKCDKLMELLLCIRKCIRCNNQATRLEGTNMLKSYCNMIDVEELKKIYKKEDSIICSEKVFMNQYTKLFKDIEKYRVLDNTRDYCNGDIVFQKIKKVKTELRHGFTIHSVQGVTIQKDNKLFIDTRKIKSLKMLYTALSRAKYINQIYLLK